MKAGSRKIINDKLIGSNLKPNHSLHRIVNTSDSEQKKKKRVREDISQLQNYHIQLDLTDIKFFCTNTNFPKLYTISFIKNDVSARF